MVDLAGQQLGPYKILSKLGEGGMALVYSAEDLRLGRVVAIKVIKGELSETDTFIKRFEREARVIAALSHPHILKVFDFGHSGSFAYLVTELMTGGSLSERIRSEPLTDGYVLETLTQVGRALDYAHGQGIIHRDLKPANVLLDQAGNAFLTDFGLAKLMREDIRLTSTGMIMGSPMYMSPEQWSGLAVDSRTDVYALGVMLFEMLTHHPPFDGETPFRLMNQHANEPARRIAQYRPELPIGVQHVLDRALAKRAEDRYSTAGDLVTAFRDAMMGKLNLPAPAEDHEKTHTLPVVRAAIPSPQPTQAPIPTPATAKHPPFLLIGIVAVAAFLVIGGVAFSVINSGNTAAISGTQTQVALAATQPVTPPTLAVTNTRLSVATATFAVIPTTALPPTVPPTVAPTLPPTATLRQATQTALPATPTRFATDVRAGTLVVNATGSAVARANAISTEVTSRLTQTALAAPTATITLTPTEPPTITPSFTPIPPSATITPTPTITLVGGGKSQIAFFSTRRNSNDLYIMNSDGSNVRPLTNAPSPSEEYGNVSPAPNGRILFASNRGGDYQIWSVNPDGTDVKQLTFGNPMNLNPVMSPDGTQIAFVSTRDGGNFEIYMMNADGSNQQRLTNSPGFDTEPTWVGNSLIFMSGRSGSFQLYLLRQDNPEELQQLTFLDGDVRSPAISPADGNLIAFEATKSGRSEIYIVNLYSGAEFLLTKAQEGEANSFNKWPNWSPDGSQLTFTSNRFGNTEIFLINADGTGLRRLTNNPLADGDAGARWLP
jgi:serine/threonine-protein kinase